MEKKYYYNGKLSFEGQLINEKKNGKGKGYHENGKLQYDGEYKDDLLNGNVKEYDNKGKLIFDGEYKDNHRWKGRADDEEFQGEYLNGIKQNGKGVELKKIMINLCPRKFRTIESFEGEYINGKKIGTGVEYNYGKGTLYRVKYDGKQECFPDYDYAQDIDINNYIFIYDD